MATTPKKPAPMTTAQREKLMATFEKGGKPKATPKPTAKPNAAEKLIQDVTNRYRVTAREARDIVTAVGTLGRTALTGKNEQAVRVAKGTNNDLKWFPENKGKNIAAAAKNVVKQVNETGTAAKSGKKGTTSAKANSVDKIYPKTPLKSDIYIQPGKKRK